MGIFKNITRTLKQAAPIIGSAIGMYFGGPLGASIGSGIGSLAAGRSAEEALRNAALTGATTYAIGGKDFGREFNFDTSGSPFAGREVVGQSKNFFAGSDPSMSKADLIKTATQDSRTFSGPSFFSKLIPESTMGKLALAGGIGALALGGEEEEKKTTFSRQPDPVGRSRLGIGSIGNKAYNLDDPEERRQYFEDLRKQQGITPTRFAAGGGEVEGPGTGTSDSVPARLSDGEFVLTAKAVRGAGGGDRDLGAARMYDMMSELERVA